MEKNRPFFVPMIVMVTTAMIALLLFVASLVLWLSEIMGSVIYPCLIVGAVFMVAALCIYFCSVRAVLKSISEQLGMVYAVSRAIHKVYAWILRRLDALLSAV